jgi:hypothetical protein
MHSHSWMSRIEAAAHLRISVRQLDRLRLTRSYIGRRALYSREALDAHLLSLQTMPLPRPRHRVANMMPLPGPTRLRRCRDSGAWLENIRAALKAA